MNGIEVKYKAVANYAPPDQHPPLPPLLLVATNSTTTSTTTSTPPVAAADYHRTVFPYGGFNAIASGIVIGCQMRARPHPKSSKVASTTPRIPPESECP
ncbi:hypothetical protein M0804_002346 [Polistes exclamans]|nr:hypothetical protein M0804_002346 [Polistes exclamans]